MSSLAALLLIVPLAALSPFRPTTTAAAEGGTSRGTSRVAPAVSAPTASVLAAPGSLVAPATPAASTLASCDRMQRRTGQVSRRVHTSSGDAGEPQLTEYSVMTDERCVEARLHGAVRFNAEADDVAWIADGARATFRERVDGEDRTAVLTSGGDGQVSRTVRFDGERMPLDGEARAWLGRMIGEFVREAAIDVKPRVKRLHAGGGVRAVLVEVDRIKSPSSKRAYYEALLDDGGLSPDDLEQLTRRATRDLAGSSGDLSAVLRRIPPGATRSSSARAAVGSALTRVDSDGDRRAVLSTLVPTADRELLLVLARSAAEIESDGDKSAFLRVAALHYLGPNDQPLRAAYFNAVNTIDSDGDRGVVLTDAIRYAHAAPAVALEVFRSVEGMSSDGDKAVVLVTAAEQRLLTTATIRDAYMRAARTVASDGDSRRVLTAALHQQRSY